MAGDFAVAQLGARMHYAVPRILHSRGRLHTLYTDICAQKGWPRLLSLIPPSARPASIARLAGRVVPGVPAARIRAFNSFGFEYARRRARAGSASELDEVFLWAGARFGHLVLEAGLDGAGSIYTFNTAGRELLQHARARGLRGIVEQTIAPRASELRLLRQEQDRHPDWEPMSEPSAAAEALVQREREEWAAADLILCASPFVRDEIAACGGPAARCAVVPYGVDAPSAVARSEASRGPLRVLTAGAVGLRKGSPYVLAAAKQLGGRAEFRMVGTAAVPARVLEELRRHLDLRGAVPRAEMRAHFAWAEVFLLPSICEGSATATYEALAHGLPVIATPNTGSVVRDGLDGFIVPCADWSAIAEKLGFLHENRDRLDEMSRQARRRAEEFTVKNYGQRLLAALETPADRVA